MFASERTFSYRYPSRGGGFLAQAPLAVALSAIQPEKGELSEKAFMCVRFEEHELLSESGFIYHGNIHEQRKFRDCKQIKRSTRNNF